jgi:hypothetical protein
MKNGLLEKIRGMGHWRVNIRPKLPLKDGLSFARCQEVVEQSRVSLRGWDYPHLSRRNDEEGGSERAGDYLEYWCDWHGQVEFWRMYKSGQFVSYSALNDDSEGPHGAGVALSVLDAIYTVSEFLEFAGRFINHMQIEGVALHMSLIGTRGRQLTVPPMRMPFLDARVTGADAIELARDVSRGDVTNEIATKVLLELFDHFGWNPDPAMIQADQEKLYRRQFY